MASLRMKPTEGAIFCLRKNILWMGADIFMARRVFLSSFVCKWGRIMVSLSV